MISRLGRKRRERRANTQPDHPFEIESCEYLTDGAFALVRVTGVGSVAPVALITQGDGPESFDTLPQPDEGVHDGVWQIAFALPTGVVEPGARVWLHDGGLYLADMLIPAPADAKPEPEPQVEPDPEPVPVPVAAVEYDEAAQLREQLADREAELLRGEIARLEQELAGARAEITAAEEQRAELEEANKSRRAGVARRKEDRDARRQVAELEAQVAARDKHIAALEAEAGDSLREQIAALEEDARQSAASNDDLRALLDSEREAAAAARREIEDLKQQLAAASSAGSNGKAPRPAVKPTASSNGVQSPPWSSVDDELLARIEKAKALTR